MKGNHSQLLGILGNSNIGFFTLMELNWRSNYFYTDFGSDIVWNGNTYRAKNPISGSDSIRYSNVVDRELFRFQLSGLDTSINNEIAAGVVHKPVRMRMVFVVNGVPQLGVNDTLFFYDGLVSSTDQKINSEEKISIIECTAPLSDLDATGTLFTTRDGIKRFDNTDTSFDSIFEGSEETSLKWGKL